MVCKAKEYISQNPVKNNKDEDANPQHMCGSIFMKYFYLFVLVFQFLSFCCLRPSETVKKITYS